VERAGVPGLDDRSCSARGRIGARLRPRLLRRDCHRSGCGS
jgi:hypothetical protein